MTEKETKDSIPDNLNYFTPNDIKNFLRWKSLELVVLGYRLHASIKALEEHADFPNTEVVLTSLNDNVTGLIDAVRNFSKLLGISEEEAGEYSFSITSYNEEIPLNLIAEKKNRKEKISFQEHVTKIEEILKTIKIKEPQSLWMLSSSLMMFGMFYFVEESKSLQKQDARKYSLLDHKLRDIAHEALGYWTAKLEQIKTAAKSNATKKEQRAIKEQHVTDAFLKLRNANKEALEGLSQNQIAKRIQEKAIDTLKHKTTKTGVLVLKRNIGKDGNIKYSGLDIDTVIDIMKKTDRFKLFNPFKPKTV